MINDSTKKHIKDIVIKSEISDGMSESVIDRALICLDQYLYLIEDSYPNTEKYLNELPQLPSDMLKYHISDYTEIEQLMKSILIIVDPELAEKKPASQSQWMLQSLFKEAFGIVHEKFNLFKECETPARNKYLGQEDYLYYYLTQYKYRNKKAHDLIYLPQDELNLIVKAYLICLLDLCAKNREALNAAYQHKKRGELFNMEAYCSTIIKQYEDQCAKGFKYVDINWADPNTELTEGYNAEELIELSKHTRHLKLTGVAGAGKTTALRHIEYLMAKKAAMNRAEGTNHPVPIFISLYTVISRPMILHQAFAEAAGIEIREVEAFFKNENICLLLDGYNEILDPETKVQFAKQTDQFAKIYPNVTIILSDRNMQDLFSCPVLVNAKSLRMIPITAEMMETYFRENCSSENTLKIILDEMQADPYSFEEIDTPLKMNNLILCVEVQGAVPEDFVASYLEAVIRREREEKKDSNMDNMEWLLSAFACALYSRFDTTTPHSERWMLKPIAFAVMNKFKNKLGLSTPNVDKFIDLAINLDILRTEDQKIGFASPKYYDYYITNSFTNGIFELLSAGEEAPFA